MRAVVLAALLLAKSPTSGLAATLSATPAQTFSAIGGSGAWWPNDLFNFPDAVRQNLSTLLFSQSGLGLSHYRYNLGSGGVGVTVPLHAPQSFYVSPGVYDFTADPQGVHFMQQAAAHGISSFTAFAISAPAQLTSNNLSCGGTFVPGTEAAYGTFIADVVSHFRSTGINIDFVSPMHEPDDSFAACTQEGMAVPIEQRADVINAVFAALQDQGLSDTVGILADESSTVALASSESSAWLPSVADKVVAIAHHLYDYPDDSSYTSFVDTVQSVAPGKATWMSDICCGLGAADGTGRAYAQGFDPTITNALMSSGVMFQSFVLAGEPQFDFWTLVSSSLGCSPLEDALCTTTPNSVGWTDGLIYYDPAFATNNNFALYITKHFWTFKHFGNFIKPGSVLIDIPLVGDDVTQTMMAVSTSTTYNLILMNPTTTDSVLTLSFPDTVCAVSAFRTSETEDFATVAAATQDEGSTAWELPLQSMSLTTFTFNRAAC
ncbi:Glycoside hydrolase family 30 protein [Mycena sanguinolenta]|uniref:Glycoside hydrolase family 30 protein n=1 Tax=Mycena sanguinolenta TaxID=230812 RepID=A0A8H6XJW8_9AGAR|nr:Glycoside hydrolase family 30 protein [Mycena sanguinolenta]